MTHGLYHSRRSAFTLIEAIATMVILSTLGIVSGGMVMSAMQSYSQGSVRAEIHNEASLAMERLVREIRSLPAKPDGNPNISELHPSSMIWTGTTHSIALVNNQLLYTQSGTARVLLSDVTGFTLRAYGVQNTPLAPTLIGDACNDIRRISLTISVTRANSTNTIQTRVFLRCMMY